MRGQAHIDPDTLDQLNTSVLVLVDGRVVFANRAAALLLGRPPAELIGRTPADLSPPLQPDGRASTVAADQYLRQARSGRATEFLWHHLGADGAVVECQIVLHRRVGCLLAEFKDITAHRSAEARLADALEGTIQAMARTVQVRDPYTSGHQLRVAQLAEAIGEVLGLDEHRIRGLVLGATIHDVGKLYVPLDFLNRPGPLNEIEMTVVRQHCTIGAEMLAPVDFPWPLQAIIAQHHERMDGSGYPHGLRGDAILLESRVVAVADTVEAMASHRPYRPALGVPAALAEIRRGRGTRFDPQVTDACLQVFDEGFSWDRPSRQLMPVKTPRPLAG